MTSQSRTQHWSSTGQEREVRMYNATNCFRIHDRVIEGDSKFSFCHCHNLPCWGCCIQPRGNRIFLFFFLYFCTLHTIQWIVVNIIATPFQWPKKKIWWILQWRVRLKDFPNKLKMYVVFVNGAKKNYVIILYACTYTVHTLECRWHLLNCKWK